ncbi:MoaD/ThiS family protein [Flavobacterium sp.]|uniref:MoaD/ThiS family protein n=1 Tax=Flavobacterium sp. TaxID=239 RepID=UPI00286BFC4E|nr:MoaD/ThiS family protein [Flavobacterium sp.]
MTITVKYFGIIADFTQKKEETFALNEVNHSIQLLQSQLEKLYPEIKSTTYSLAINQKLTNQNAILHDQDEVALLPPFAGG